MYRLGNVIASTKIGGKFDLEYLSEILNNAQYEPEQFPGLVYRKEYTIIMFYSGKISSHGTSNLVSAVLAIEETILEIEKAHGIIGSSEYSVPTIENIVATGDLFHKVDLIEKSQERNVMYEPDQFPGLMARPFDDSIVCLIFSTGKFNIVGAKNVDQINKAYEFLVNKY
mgnify:CR=1 FL=1